MHAFVVPECGYPGRELAYAIDAGSTCDEVIAKQSVAFVGTWMFFGVSSLPDTTGTYVIGNDALSPDPSWAFECEATDGGFGPVCTSATSGSLTVTSFSQTARTATGSYTLIYPSSTVTQNFEATICEHSCP